MGWYGQFTQITAYTMYPKRRKPSIIHTMKNVAVTIKTQFIASAALNGPSKGGEISANNISLLNLTMEEKDYLLSGAL